MISLLTLNTQGMKVLSLLSAHTDTRPVTDRMNTRSASPPPATSLKSMSWSWAELSPGPGPGSKQPPVTTILATLCCRWPSFLLVNS